MRFPARGRVDAGEGLGEIGRRAWSAQGQNLASWSYGVDVEQSQRESVPLRAWADLERHGTKDECGSSVGSGRLISIRE